MAAFDMSNEYLRNDHSDYSVRVWAGTVLAEGTVAEMIPHDMSSPEGAVVTKGLLKEVKNTEVGVFKLVPGSFDPEIINLGIDSIPPATAIFNELADLALTRQESVHNVQFGQLIVNSYFGDERAELAALKPFDTAQQAAHELSLSRYFLGIGNTHGFSTFEALGIVRLSTGKYGLLTKYDHGVRSLDNVVWNPENELSARTTTVARAIGKSAYVLAAMHSAGWTHGDPQIKNMYASNHEKPFIGDLESMQSFKRDKSGRPDQFAIEKYVDGDIRKLAGSLTARRERGIELPEDLIQLFSLIYLGIVNSPQSAVPAAIRKTTKDLRTLLKDQY